MEKKVKAKGKGGDGGGELDHVCIERERRKKMKNMFNNLHALLPQLPSKADHCAVVDEAVRYIKSLEQVLQTLQKQRLDILRNSSTSPSLSWKLTDSRADIGGTREAFMADHVLEEEDRPPKKSAVSNSISRCIYSQASCFKTWFSPNVVMNMSSHDAQISVCSPRKPGLLSTIFNILEKHKLDVRSAHISSDHHRCIYMIHAHHASRARDDLPFALSVEDTFKLAAGEMNLYLLSP